MTTTYDVSGLSADLPTLRRLGTVLREHSWAATAVVEMDSWDRHNGSPRLVDLLPPDRGEHLWGAAVDIGTTTVSLYLVDLLTGEVVTKAAELGRRCLGKLWRPMEVSLILFMAIILN